MAQSDMPPAHLRPQAETGEDFNCLEVTIKKVSTCVYIIFATMQLMLVIIL